MRLCQVSALCVLPVTPANTIVEPGPHQLGGYSIGTSVNVSCNNSAFYIPGPTSPAVYSRRCMSDSLWSGSDILPECIRGYCVIDPADPPNSMFVYECYYQWFAKPLPSGAKSYGTTRFYDCKEGLIIVGGNGELRCEGNDIWNYTDFGECKSMSTIHSQFYISPFH